MKIEAIVKLQTFTDKINQEMCMLGCNILHSDKHYNDYTNYTLKVDTYFDNGYEVLIVCSNDLDSFDCEETLGVAWIEIIDVDGILKKDIEWLKFVLDKVEENLVKVGVPFDTDYKFSQDWLKEKNIENRAKYDLDNLEDELLQEENNND